MTDRSDDFLRKQFSRPMTGGPGAHPDHPITDKPPAADAPTDPGELRAEDLEEIRAEARAQVAKERRKEAMKVAMEQALREERLAAGLEHQESTEIMVDYTPDIPDNVTPHACWTIDGRTYWHGVTYRVTKAQAQSFLSMEARARENLAREQGRWFDPRKPNQGLRPVAGMPGMMLS